MEVYIEYVAINNFAIDYMLIMLTRRVMKLTTKRIYVFLSAAIGAGFAVITPIFKMNGAFTLIVKMLEGAVIILSSGEFPSPRVYVRSFYLFLFFTFSFGGAVFAVFYFVGKDYDVFARTSAGKTFYTPVLAIVFVVFVLTDCVIKKLYRRREIVGFLRKCEFKLGGKTYVANGFLDSGNRLRYKSDPVIIVSPEFSARLKKNNAFKNLMPRFVPVSTVAGEKLIICYKLDKIKIYNGKDENIISNVMLGISDNDFKSGGEYDLILGLVFA